MNLNEQTRHPGSLRWERKSFFCLKTKQWCSIPEPSQHNWGKVDNMHGAVSIYWTPAVYCVTSWEALLHCWEARALDLELLMWPWLEACPSVSWFSPAWNENTQESSALIRSSAQCLLYSVTATDQHMCAHAQPLSRVWLIVTPWTIACEAPLSMEFSRQEYWSGLPFPSPGDLPDAGIEPGSPVLQADSWPSELPGSSIMALVSL